MGDCWCWIINTLIALQKLSIIMTSQFTHLLRLQFQDIYIFGTPQLTMMMTIKIPLLFYCFTQHTKKAFFDSNKLCICTKKVFPFSLVATLSSVSFNLPEKSCRFSVSLLKSVALKKERKSFVDRWRKEKGKSEILSATQKRISCNKETTLFWPETQAFFLPLLNQYLYKKNS